MSAKQRKTRAAVFQRPVRSNIRWADIESLFGAMGADVEERSGSRVGFVWDDGSIDVFHRPHPSPYANKASVVQAKKVVERQEEDEGNE
jgi:hypothetical protein